MKKQLSLAVVSLLLAVTTLSGSRVSSARDRDSGEGVRDRLIGSWRLVWLEEEGAPRLHLSRRGRAGPEPRREGSDAARGAVRQPDDREAVEPQ